MDITRRQALGGLASTAVLTLPRARRVIRRAATTDPGPYGSGYLGAWQGNGHSLSRDDQFTDTRAYWMYGDSIAYRCQEDLANELWAQKGHTLAVDDWPGRPTTPSVDALAARLTIAPAPPVIIMSVGTNDIFDPTPMAAQIARTMSLVPASTTVAWIDVQCCRTAGTFQVADQRNSGWVNNQIHDAAHQYPNLIIVPWFTSLSEAPGRITEYLIDGVHPSDPTGVAFHNAVLIQALP